MKRAETVLDMEKDRAVMYIQPVKLDFTSSGHYCVSITDRKEKGVKNEDRVLVAVEDTSNELRMRNTNVIRKH